MSEYYGAPGESSPGISQRRQKAGGRNRFAGLDQPEVAARFLRFDDGERAVVTLALPDIHCASCVWLLEQLWRFDPAVTRSEVDLQHRTITVEYRSGHTSVRAIAERLTRLGYEPSTDAERDLNAVPATRRRLYLQLGVAGFAFGNIMIFSIPRYASGQSLQGGFQTLFDVLNEKVGHLSKGGVAIHDIRQLKRIVRQEHISIAVVAVPASAAQYVVNLVVGAGVKAVLNFSPGTLTVPPDVKLKSVDLTVSLESLSFFLARGEGGHVEA